jgi:hypothetical protein
MFIELDPGTEPIMLATRTRATFQPTYYRLRYSNSFGAFLILRPTSKREIDSAFMDVSHSACSVVLLVYVEIIFVGQ